MAGGISWRECVTSPWKWVRAANQAGADGTAAQGEAGGFFVTADEVQGRRAYLKPLRKPSADRPARAAREKIVSDLAADLGIRVPPVMLYEREDASEAEERWTCVSLVLYPVQWSWGQVRRIIMDGRPQVPHEILTKSLPTTAAHALALDTWVGQYDHNDHPHNMAFGYNPGVPHEGEYVLFDYAIALGAHGSWANQQWRLEGVAPVPPYMSRFFDQSVLESTVSAIEAVPAAQVDQIVNRIPDSYMTESDRAYVLEGLLGRKARIRDILSKQLEKKGGAT